MSVVNAVPFLKSGSDETALALTTIFETAIVQAPRTSMFLWDRSLPFIKRQKMDYGKAWVWNMRGWDPEAEDFTPGEELVGQDFAYYEGQITADKVLVAHKYIPWGQMHQSHFQVLEDTARENIYQLEVKYDYRMMLLAARGARAAAVTKDGMTIHNGGNVVVRDGASAVSDTAVATAYPQTGLGALNALDDLKALASRFDEDHIDPRNRWLFPRTDFYQALLCNSANPLIWGSPSNTAVAGESQLFSKNYQGVNSVLDRQVLFAEGWKIMAPANKKTGMGPFPNENVTTGQTKFQGNFLPRLTTGTPVALAFGTSMKGEAAIGINEYSPIMSGVFWKPERLSYLCMSWMFVGTDYMHPFCIGSIEVTDPTP